MSDFVRKATSFFTETLLGAQPRNTDREQLVNLRARVERAQQLKNLMNHPGFKILMDDVDTHIEAIGQGLELAKDMDEVRRLQSAAREAKFWRDYVPQQVEDGESDLERLKELMALSNATETASNG